MNSHQIYSYALLFLGLSFAINSYQDWLLNGIGKQFLFGIVGVQGQPRLTNLECIPLDKNLTRVRYCRLYIPKRGTVACDIHIELLKIPFNNIIVNLSLWRRFNGYRPFMYNVTANFCEFMKNRNRFPFLKIFFNFIWAASNANHTCPYNHDIIIKNLVMTKEMLQLIPFPAGDYLFYLKVGHGSTWMIDVKVYMAIFDA